LGHARLYELAQRLELPDLARFSELGFLDDLKDLNIHESMDTPEELVRFVYVSKPLGVAVFA